MGKEKENVYNPIITIKKGAIVVLQVGLAAILLNIGDLTVMVGIPIVSGFFEMIRNWWKHGRGKVY